jgi:CheY-like chemotaxis protein
VEIEARKGADNMREIVVVDDNPTLLDVLSEIFRDRGFSVRTVSDGFAALAAIRDCLPDILISDLNMPGMSGFELLSVVRRRFPEIAVIAMSGMYSSTSVSPRIAADGFYAKGTSNVARLFEILREIDNEEVRKSRRATAPIWVPGLPIHQDDLTTTVIACPECLRAFLHSLHSAEGAQEERCCPYCFYPLKLAVVAQSCELDRSGPSYMGRGCRD